MKFAFLCIVIIISCSVCASGDLEIYPGLKFDLSSEEQRHSLENTDKSALYGVPYPKWPMQNLPLDDYRDEVPKEPDFDFPLPERFRNLEQFLKHGRLRDDEDLPFYYDPRNFEEAYERYRDSQNAIKLSRYDNLRFPSVPILEDVRPYPHDDDFSFGEDDDEDVEKQPYQLVRETSNPEAGKDENSHESHQHRKTGFDGTTPEASGKGALDDVKVVEDPTQFAYSPSDIRFFQSSETTDVSGPTLPRAEKLKDNKIHLAHRSDEKFREEINPDDLKKIEKLESLMEVVSVKPHIQNPESAGVYIIAIVAGISAAATVGLIAVGIGWYNLQKHVKSASDVEYPAYGVTGPNKDTSPSGDRRLAQSAQMYHYQHQKQQIIAMESRAAAGDRHGSVSEADSDEENEEGDYTVYECPGLAPTGEMEVKNPLFQDDPTPALTPPVKPNGTDKK